MHIWPAYQGHIQSSLTFGIQSSEFLRPSSFSVFPAMDYTMKLGLYGTNESGAHTFTVAAIAHIEDH